MAGHGGSVGTGGVGGAGDKGGGGMAGGAAGQGGGSRGTTANGHVRRPLPERRGLQTGQLQERVLLQHGLPEGPARPATARVAACTNVMTGQDPRNDCPMAARRPAASKAGATAAGACPSGPPATACSKHVECSGTGAVIQGAICDGQGHCSRERSGELQRFPLSVERLLDELHRRHRLRRWRILRRRHLRRDDPEPGRATVISSTAPPTDGPRSRTAAGFPRSLAANGGTYCARADEPRGSPTWPRLLHPDRGSGNTTSACGQCKTRSPGRPPSGFSSSASFVRQGTYYYTGNIEDAAATGESG